MPGRGRTIFTALVASSCLSGLVSAPAAAGDATPPAGDAYVVRFVDGADPELERIRLRNLGVEVDATFASVFPGAAVTASAAELDELHDDPRVVSISPNVVMRAAPSGGGEAMSAAAVQTNAPWGLDRVDQHERPLSTTFSPASTGAGVDMYVLDSGIRADHTEFAGRLQPGYFDDAFTSTDDCDGHGTHVAGTAGGTTYGVAKAVTIIPVRVLDCEGETMAGDVLDALDWIVDHHQPGQPAVLNASIGAPGITIVDQAFQEAIDDGITVVLAAGNEFTNACTTSPARLPAAITVGATDIVDNRPAFSNWGACLDLFAPGVNIRSAWIDSSTDTAPLSGTSMASPHVAGAAALILERMPYLTPAQVAAHLVNDSTPNVVTNPQSGSPNRLLFTPTTVAPPPPADTDFVSLVPARLLDTRPGSPTADGLGTGHGLVPAGGVVPVTVGGRGGVDPAASAVVLNVTVTEPAAAGFVTVFPCGSGVPNSSSVNVAAHATVANAVVAQVGTGAQVCLFTNVAAHLVVDVNGYFPAGASFSPEVPARVLDTRPGMPTADGLGAGQDMVGSGGVVELVVAGRGGVAPDASAVVLNVTAVDPLAAGFVTVFPCGSALPNSSSVNYVAGSTVANAVVSKIGPAGTVCLYTNAPTHLLADVNGWFPAGASYSPVVPARLLETRPGLPTADGFSAGGGMVPSGGVVELLVAGRGGVDIEAAAVVLNVTVTEPAAAGFVTVFPCGSGLPNSSSVNFLAGATVANAVVAKVGAGGRVCLFTNVATHLLTDVTGYFPGG